MIDIRLDHILTFTNVPDIDAYVNRYRALGFLVSDETRSYQPGLRNRFIQFGCEYVELVWVEDETAFAKGGADEFARIFPNLSALRQGSRPFSIGWNADSVEDLHEVWSERGFQLPEVWSFAPPGMPPALSFQVIPDDLLPGASCFAITYLGRDLSQPEVRTVYKAANTTYAIEGITFVSATPAENAARWSQTLEGGTVAQGSDRYVMMIPPHSLWWATPQQFEARYALQWTASPHAHGDIAALHLLADNLDAAASLLGQQASAQEDPQTHEKILVIPPTAEDGVTFILRQYPIERWCSKRSAVTGETIRLM